jgi:hypothetical protein
MGKSEARGGFNFTTRAYRQVPTQRICIFAKARKVPALGRRRNIGRGIMAELGKKAT